VISIVHTALALRIFQPFSEFLRSPDMHAFDFCVLEQQIETARLAFDASWRLWGYDPRFLAGYVETFLWNSNVALQVLGVVLRPLSAGQVVKLATVLTALALQPIFYLAWRWFGADRRSSLLGAIVGIVWFRATEVFAFWAIGMTTGYFVFPLSLLGLAALASLLRSERRYELAIIAPLALLTHKTACVTLGIPAAVMIAMNSRRISRRVFAIIACAAATTVALNAFWMFPLIHAIPDAAFDAVGRYWSNPDPWAVVRDLVSPTARWGVFDRPNWPSAMLAKDLAVIALLVAAVRPAIRRSLPPGFLPGGMVLVLLAYAGSFVSAARGLDPSRYIPFVTLVLGVPAALALTREAVAGGRWTVLFVATCGVMLVAPSPTTTFRDRPIPATNSAELERVAEWIKSLPGSGRVHVETFNSFEGGRPPGREEFARYAYVLPSVVDRPLAGGFYSGLFTLYNHVNFHSGNWLGRPVSELAENDLREALRVYHIEFVLTWSVVAGDAFERYSSVTDEIPAPAGYRAWRVRDPGAYVLEGSGRLVRAAMDRLEFAEVTTGGDRVTLSFHWSPTLRAEGGAIEPVRVLDDPVPFIGLRATNSHVVITNGGTW
ncbi:MAG: hypothetical protein KJ042_06240, partial [Deltaproteobacteria bacterium]|nr:hypothetical protein [Deltaproteobacteria bacterium]